MKKTYYLILIALLTFGLSACKKDSKPKIPAGLIGKWYLRQYSITTSTGTSTDPPYTTPYNDTATYIYYQFNNDGTGLEQTSSDPNFVIVPPSGFTYHVSGTSITFSHNSTIMMPTTCSYEMPTSNKLIIRGNYSYTSAGGVANNLQVITLSK